MMGKYTRKEFVLYRTEQIELKNLTDFMDDIEKKIDILQQCASDTVELTKTVDQIFLDFLGIYQFDCDTAILPEPFGHFENEEVKRTFLRKRLLSADFNLHLGTVFCNFHERLYRAKQLPDVILGKFVVDYPQLYNKALFEYFSSLLGLQPNYPFELFVQTVSREDRNRIIAGMQVPSPPNTPKAFVANYIFPSLIETYLKEFLQKRLIDKIVPEVKLKYQQGNVTLTKEELGVMEQFWSKNRWMRGSKEEMLKICYSVFERSGLIEEPKSMKPLITGMARPEKHQPLMLNGLLSNQYVGRHLLRGHLEMMRLLFSGDKLNIRNNVMHGVNVTYDPFAICYSSVMLQIFWSIIGEDIFI